MLSGQLKHSREKNYFKARGRYARGWYEVCPGEVCPGEVCPGGGMRYARGTLIIHPCCVCILYKCKSTI